MGLFAGREEKMSYPVLKGIANVLVHTPDLVRYGSKPAREIPKDPGLIDRLTARLRSYEEAVAYPPHQVYVGNLRPEKLWDIERPWFRNLHSPAERFGLCGEIMPQAEFYGFMKIVDEFELVEFERRFISGVRGKLAEHPLITSDDLARLGAGIEMSALEAEIASGALPLYEDGRIAGCFRQGHDEDENLFAPVLLENLSAKASGILALRYVIRDLEGGGQSIDYVMSCGEEGVGDRYQRGAGNIAKAMAEFAGCLNSSGTDVKAFCCAPVHSLVLAAGLVQSGIFKNVAVVGGGSLAKLGMKMRGHLARETPIMEDVLGAIAVLVSADDGKNPQMRLDSIGKHDVAAGSSPQAIMTALVSKPLNRLGLKIKDIDKFATEMHNPEITEPAGSGNVPNTNYRMIGGLAVMNNEMPASKLNDFVRQYGMPGFSPTQGHIAAAVPFLGHAREMILNGEITRAMFVAKGSLFLGKMTKLSDGMSFILEKNRGENNGS